jgi:hypothetical protein
VASGATWRQKAAVASSKIYRQHALQHLQHRPCRWPFSTLHARAEASLRQSRRLDASVEAGLPQCRHLAGPGWEVVLMRLCIFADVERDAGTASR